MIAMKREVAVENDGFSAVSYTHLKTPLKFI